MKNSDMQRSRFLPEFLYVVLALTALVVGFSVTSTAEVLTFRIYLGALLLFPAVVWALLPRLYLKTRALLLSVLMLTLYMPCGRLGMILAQGTTYDDELDRIDRSIFGFDLSYAAQLISTPVLLEIAAFTYSLFIPYIYLSLFLHFAESDDDHLADRIFLGFSFLYFVSFMGYLFVPAQGPAGFPAVHNHVSLPGGYFFGLVQDAVEQTGGWLGAFPSLHVGASLFFCLADRERDPLRSFVFAPVFVGIVAATILLRCHYAIDLVAGVLCALSAWYLAGRIVKVEGKEAL